MVGLVREGEKRPEQGKEDEKMSEQMKEREMQ